MRRSSFAFGLAVGTAAILAGCGGDSGTNPTPKTTVDTIVASAALDGFVETNGTVSTTGGGPAVGDLDAGVGGGVGTREFFGFSLSSVPTSATVTAASLELDQCVVGGSPYTKLGNVIVDHVDFGSTLTSAAYGMAALSADIGTLSSDATTGYKKLDVKTSVQNDLSLTRINSEYRLRFSSLDANNDGIDDIAVFRDAEGSAGGDCTSAGVPRLIVTFQQ